MNHNIYESAFGLDGFKSLRLGKIRQFLQVNMRGVENNILKVRIGAGVVLSYWKTMLTKQKLTHDHGP